MRLTVSVIAGARTTGVISKGEAWKVKVQTAPDKGKANDAVRGADCQRAWRAKVARDACARRNVAEKGF